MSSHPNAMLLLVMTPDNTSRKTYREILAEAGCDADEAITIGDSKYYHKVIEDDYDESYQIAASEGDIVFWNLVTYGYGERITWAKLDSIRHELDAWATEVCAKYQCKHEIFVSANYW